jgi:hypothetical protein
MALDLETLLQLVLFAVAMGALYLSLLSDSL